MPLARPQFIVLDSATLGKVSRDYWSPDKKRRDKARTFVARLLSQNVFITFTITHVLELLGHKDESVVRDRLKFLRILPLIAWLRPYDFNGLPGGIPDLLRHELHAVVHETKHDWRVIIEQVRKNLWETGLGSEMFVDDDHLWSILRIVAQNQLQRQLYVASVTRTDPGHIYDLTYGESKQLKKRPKAERVAYMRRFAATMKVQLEQHGDRRLESPQDAAVTFANEMLKDADLFEAAGGDPIQRMLEFHRVP